MRIIFSLIAASALFLSAPSANAEQFCAARDTALVQLEKQFGELISGRGLAANGKRPARIPAFIPEPDSWNFFVASTGGETRLHK